MTSRKEEKERLREARLEAERRAAGDERRRLLLGYVVAGVLTAAVVAGIVVVIVSGGDGEGGDTGGDNARIQAQSGTTAGLEPDDRAGAEVPAIGETTLEAAAEAAGCELLLDQRDEGNQHIDPSSPAPDYRSSPPTSGNHSPEPLADGAYLEAPSPLNFIHSLEHGRVEYQYDPGLAERAQLEIKGIFLEDSAGMLMFPNPDMPYEVAAGAWTNLLGCESYEGRATLDALRAFRNDFRGRGPEPVPLSL